MWRKTLVILSKLRLKFGANIKEKEWLKKENILVDYERHQDVRTENSKKYAVKIENVQQNKRKINGWLKSFPQQSMHKCRLKSWIIFSFRW